MSIDGVITRALVQELAPHLINNRINKIYQPSKHELLFHLRKGEKLLISAHPSYPRLHLTEQDYINPPEPPMFCMLLRKHLTGAVIVNISQVALERVVHLDFDARDVIGDSKRFRLIIELMGKHSNIILLDPQTDFIYDSIKKVNYDISSYREILPGKLYKEPPEQNKQNPFTITEAEFHNLQQQQPLDKWLVATFQGISPLVAREIVAHAEATTLWTALYQLLHKEPIQPSLTHAGGKDYFYLWPLSSVSQSYTTYPTLSLGLEAFYADKSKRDQLKQQSQDISKRLELELKKNQKKIAKLEQELAEVATAEHSKLCGELLTANLHALAKGANTATLLNYHTGEQLEITLEPQLSPIDNAKRYFKKYKKLTARQDWNKEQIALAIAANHYLESILVQLQTCNQVELEQIRAELHEEGYLRRAQTKRRKDPVVQPASFQSSEGVVIMVGKNNKQNELLTHKLAAKGDTWLHAKEIPGSHVVIRSNSFAEATLQEAAQLAAYFSKARNSANVPIDYTLVRHIKKPSGAKPGFVIYEKEQTLYVTPSEELVLKLTPTT